MTPEQYLANEAALGEESVCRLRDSQVQLIGDGQLAQAVLLNLIGLGIGTIHHAADQELGPGIIRDIAHCIDPQCATIDDAMILLHPRGEYVRGRSGSCAVSLDARGGSDDPATDLVHAGLLGNLVRRAIFPLVHEPVEHCIIDHARSSQALQVVKAAQSHVDYPIGGRNTSFPSLSQQIAVVGCGGIGSYCAYVLAKESAQSGRVTRIDLYDLDVVESHNLNRQLLYAGAIGESKAEVLAKRLSQMSGVAVQGHATRVSDSQLVVPDWRNYAAIYCCTDNVESRLSLSRHAQRNDICFVEGACTPFFGSISHARSTEIPVHEQRNLEDMLIRQKETESPISAMSARCSRVIHPSVISPNVIIGSLQACVSPVSRQAGMLYLNTLTPQIFSRGRYAHPAHPDVSAQGYSK